MASRGDVVVVTINYRLSTLGFFATGQPGSRGNYALSDMVAALDWVQNHIEDFGGDKEKVTIFGYVSLGYKFLMPGASNGPNLQTLLVQLEPNLNRS